MTPQACLKAFADAGAQIVTPDILQPAGALLDLYGEDIRARAFVTQDPSEGEMMLRPDFTVPVVQMHMQCGAEPARYAYAGPVFRRQEDTIRPREYTQVGFELFARENPGQADAEVFALFAKVLSEHPVTPTTGDIGILIAAVNALATTERRRAALRRHIWRPARFRALMHRFSGASVPATRQALIDDPRTPEAMAETAPVIGLRSPAEVAARIHALRADAAEPPIPHGEAEVISAILQTQGTAPVALKTLQDIAADLPALTPALDTFAARLDALAFQGIDLDTLPFAATYGRTSMEYYDGFVFGFAHAEHTTPVASGGRYDALTAVLGQGRSIPAVGGVIRPDLLETAS